jgi:hypothetical protein
MQWKPLDGIVLPPPESRLHRLCADHPGRAHRSRTMITRWCSCRCDGTLNAQKWNDFRKTQRGAGAAAALPRDPSDNPAAAPAAPTSSNAVFPMAVPPKYSNESAGKARMHTCLDHPIPMVV